MKKIISILLVLVLFVSLCACNTSNNTGESQSTEPTTSSTKTTDSSTSTESNTSTTTMESSTTPVVSEEEKELKAKKERYETASKYLKEYLENGYFETSRWNRYEGSEAAEYLYYEFEFLGNYEDSEEIVTRFSKTDLVTSITLKQTDYLGNISEKTYESYQYDHNGNSLHGKFFHLMDVFDFPTSLYNPTIYTYHYEYDDNNRINRVTLFEYGSTKIKSIAILKYNDSDNLIEATIKNNNGEYVKTYTYNSQNQLVKTQGGYYKFTYTYDGNGNLSEKNMWINEYHRRKTEYIYNENNNLIKKIDKDFGYENSEITDYEYDENGHIIKMTKTTEEPNNFNRIVQADLDD